MKVKTRFAPSPTGMLHVGGVRTALFSWLYARRNNGEFVLRIEDTDRERSTDESARAILDGLDWLGLGHDGEAVYQSGRTERHLEVVRKLLDEGSAYHCHCSRERLQSLREEQIAAGRTPQYDGRCRDGVGRNERSDAPVVRLKLPPGGELVFSDHVHGEIRVANETLDDLVLLRSDGSPTYNLSVVIDDMDMGITHIIRGDDHLSNTPKQIHLWRAIQPEAEPPGFVHIPLILDEAGKPLSKRSGGAALNEYINEGYLPEALVNYLLRLGWSHGDREIFTREEMIAKFDFEHISRSPAAMNREKLNWLNKHYMQEKSPDELSALLQPHLAEAGMDAKPSAEITAVLRERYDTLKGMAEGARFFYQPPEYPDGELEKRVDGERLAQIADALRALGADAWNEAPIKRALTDFAEKQGLAFGKVGGPLRYVLTGGAASPGIAETARLVGREECMARLEGALRRLKATG